MCGAVFVGGCEGQCPRIHHTRPRRIVNFYLARNSLDIHLSSGSHLEEEEEETQRLGQPCRKVNKTYFTQQRSKQVLLIGLSVAWPHNVNTDRHERWSFIVVLVVILSVFCYRVARNGLSRGVGGWMAWGRRVSV